MLVGGAGALSSTRHLRRQDPYSTPALSQTNSSVLKSPSSTEVLVSKGGGSHSTLSLFFITDFAPGTQSTLEESEVEQGEYTLCTRGETKAQSETAIIV